MAGLLAGLLLACVPEPATRPAPASTAEAGAEVPGALRPDAGSAEAAPLARGLWILAEGSERVLDAPRERLGPLLDRAARLGATDLFVQVYRGGRAFYAAGPGIERTPAVDPLEAEGVDGLQLLLDAARARGFRVHAWVNVLSLSTRRDAALIGQLGREAILVDRSGRSVLDYPDFDVPQPDRRYYRMGTRGLYLDPAVPAVRDRLVSTFVDLLRRYPDLDGLHLDYIRHPGVLPFAPGSRFGVGLEFGYGAVSRSRYRSETGRPDPIDGAGPGVVRGANAWDAWRREQVTQLVEAIAQNARATRPGLEISAAVIAYDDRAYLSLAQDWRGWLRSGALDRAIPMAYTLDDALLLNQLESYAGWPYADRIWPGLGVWLFDDAPERALDQLAQLRELGFGGEVLFSDDAIAQSPALLDALATTAPARREETRP
ncbi:MAG: family 10 glycosylhydrolase [bacterium]|nr:family 10 glycosylhydrolase [bacterium]